MADISVMPGSTHLDKVLGLNTESGIQNEGKVIFDIIVYYAQEMCYIRC